MAATTSLQSLHHPLLHHHHHCLSSTHESSPFLRPTTIPKPFPTITSTASPSSLTTASSLLATTAASTAPSFDALATHLAAADFRRADEVTRRLLIDLAGEPAQKRGYVFFSEVQFISAADLLTIDRLWRRHSADRFGYSVQRRLWEKSKRDFTSFFIRVGWMKKLDTEVEQVNYRAFPDEFTWELRDDTPEGHLPLTNALRGTQLLACVLTHPAFECEDNEEIGGAGAGSGAGSAMMSSLEEKKESKKPSSGNKKSLLNPDYSF